MTIQSTEFAPVELPSRYAKAIVAILTATISALVAALTDNHIATVELLQVAVATVTAVGVYLVPNLASGLKSWSKMIVATLGTVLQAAITLLAGGGVIDASGWLIILLAALGAISVGIVPNAHVVESTTK